MVDLAKNFEKFVKEAYPDVNRAYLITGDVLQAYIDKKASTCVDATDCRKSLAEFSPEAKKG